MIEKGGRPAIPQRKIRCNRIFGIAFLMVFSQRLLPIWNGSKQTMLLPHIDSDGTAA